MSEHPEPAPATDRAAIISHFELDRSAVQPGEPVTLHWRTLNAGTIRVTLPDDYSIDLDARSGAGSHEFTVTRTGTIRATAYGWVGQPVHASRMVTVFTEPQQVLVPIPDLRDAPMPVFGRTELPLFDRAPIIAALHVTNPARLQRSTWSVPPSDLLSMTSVGSVRSAPRVSRARRRSWLSLGNRLALPVNLSGLFLNRNSRHRLVRWFIRRRGEGADQ